MAASSVALDFHAGHEAAALETAQDAAHVAGVDAEVAGKIGCGRGPVAVGELGQDAGFSDRVRGVGVAAIEDADLAGVEPVEPANGGDLLGLFGHTGAWER